MAQAFAKLNPNLYQSDYITNKKARLATCDKKVCSSKMSYNQYNLSNRGRSLALARKIDTADLIYGLYSKMNLSKVCTVVDGFPCINLDTCTACDAPTIIDIAPSAYPFYITNTIDPVGELFGNSSCGKNNFINYMDNT